MDFKYVPSTCPYCGNGCGVNLVVKDGRFVGISPWHRNPVNEGKVCIRGNKSYEFVNHPSRLTKPLIKKGDKFEEASWEDAYKEIANAFKAAKGDAIGVVASARNSNEDAFVLKKFASDVLKTANIDYCGHSCNADAVKGLADAFGSGATTNSLADLSDAKVILVVGSNPLEENPLAGRRLIIAKNNGAKIIVADARKTATARLADLYIPCNPGTDVAIVNGIITAIIKAGKENKDYIAKHTKDFEKAKSAAASCTPEAVATAAGIDAAAVTKAAEIFTAGSPAAVVTSAGAGSGDLIRAVANLQLVTGNVGKAAAGVHLLRGKANAQGAADVGAVPGEGGLTVPAMVEAAAAGKIKALYVVGENIAAAGPTVTDALGKLDFLVVQDMFLTETAAKAKVVLPSASFAERDGTVTNAERRVQRVRKAIEPVGSAKADWQITSEIAKAMGTDFAFKDAEAVFDAITKAVPAYAGITLAALEKPEAVQWPAAGGKFGTGVLYADKFATKDGKAAFAAVEFKAPEATSAEYPLAVAAMWPMGTLSQHSASIVREWPEASVQINHDDAKALGILDGAYVKVTCKAGPARVAAVVTKNIKKGVIAMHVPAGIMTAKLEKIMEA